MSPRIRSSRGGTSVSAAADPDDRSGAQGVRRAGRGRRHRILGRPRRDRRPDRPERLGQDHGAQPDLRRVALRRRRHSLQGRDDQRMPIHHIARRGIARTFQLVRVLPLDDRSENVIAGLAFRAAPACGAPPPEQRARRAARARRPRPQGRPRGAAAHLYRPEAPGAGARVGACARSAAARRMARGPQPVRAHRRHRAGALAARRRA